MKDNFLEVNEKKKKKGKTDIGDEKKYLLLRYLSGETA